MGANVLVVYKKNHERIHDESISFIESILSDIENLNHTMRAREAVSRADFIGRDLVIVVGGDGTLTSICHNVDDQTPVMGVNSHPRTNDSEGSLGFYMDSTVDSFAEDLEAALSGQAMVNILPRIQATITSTSGNIIKTDPAVNDLLIANTHQYAPSKYRIQRGDVDERQQSSGLLFSTWLGQGAWIGHVADLASLNAQQQDSNSHYFMVARELATGKEAMSWSSEATIITSDMHRGYAVPDGWDEYHFNRGAVIKVDLGGPVLKLLSFRGKLGLN
ncbi:MAG: NAD(+)/NADH kinase [Candidatus Poseidoniaceae archaeon]|jgi:hypothetical protein|nr:NAD(+)/NADH kinase [Candidatus Poseidoniaceae archaeon]